MFAKRKAQKARKEAHQAKLRARDAARERYESTRDILDQLADYKSIHDERSGNLPIVPKRGEEVISVISGTELVEMRSRKRTYKGSSHGLSIKVMKGVYYRPSVHQGAIQETVEEWHPLDSGGDAVITDRRLVYAGENHTREFYWSKLVATQTADWRGYRLIVLPVSNRVRSSAIVADSESAELVMMLIQCAVAIYQEDHGAFIEQLAEDTETLRRDADEADREARVAEDVVLALGG
ncbi:MAG: hypothetical protein OXM62_06120 [bacterium]|nr:hypothetical protein [bacterium]MDE0234565.1 hypothetical protein [bacterium]